MELSTFLLIYLLGYVVSIITLYIVNLILRKYNNYHFCNLLEALISSLFSWVTVIILFILFIVANILYFYEYLSNKVNSSKFISKSVNKIKEYYNIVDDKFRGSN